MTTEELYLALHEQALDRPYFVRMEVLELTQSPIKARLYVLPNLFVHGRPAIGCGPYSIQFATAR